MEAKELIDPGVCVSMAEARRLSFNMKASKKCREKILKKIERKRNERSDSGRV